MPLLCVLVAQLCQKIVESPQDFLTNGSVRTHNVLDEFLIVEHMLLDEFGDQLGTCANIVKIDPGVGVFLCDPLEIRVEIIALAEDQVCQFPVGGGILK